MIKALRLNVLLFLLAEPLILVVGALVAVVRSTTAAALFPLRLLAVVLHRPVPRRPDSCSS